MTRQQQAVSPAPGTNSRAVSTLSKLIG